MALLVISLLGAGSAFADATVEQNTKIHFEGAMGHVLNFFGGRATRQGIDTTEIVKGDRSSRISGENGEIIDLGQEKIYRLDYRRKTYTVTTFDELRKQYEEAQERAKKEKPEKTEPAEKNKAPEYQVDVDIKNTGRKETISGFDTHEVIVTVTIHEKGKKLEESGGSILTSDLWIGPRVPALEELGKFNERYARKLYGAVAVPGMNMQTMAQVIAASPAFAGAMKAFAEKRDSLAGTPIRTTMTYEQVMAPGQENAEGGESAASAEGAAVKALSGLFSRHRKKESNEGPSRSTLFTSTNEIRRADLTADPSKLAIPEGYRERD